MSGLHLQPSEKPVRRLDQEVSRTPAPGIYHDIGMAEYNAFPDSTRSSLLNLAIQRTPAHARWAQLYPSPETEALRLGTIAHIGILEPDLFLTEYAEGPAVDLRTKMGRALWERALEEHQGRQVLRPKEYQTVAAIIESIWERPEHQTIRDFLGANDEREVTIVYRDPATQVLARVRLDMVGLRVGSAGDLKTSTDASEYAFAKSVADYGYDLQSAMQIEACEVVGWDVLDYAWVVVEKEPPYLANLIRLRKELLELGRTRLRQAFDVWHRCEVSGEWAGYGREVKDAGISKYYSRLLDAKNEERTRR